MVAAIALLDLATGQMAALVVPTVRAYKPVRPAPLIQGVEALISGFTEREEFIQADSFLKLHWIACHINFHAISWLYMIIFHITYSSTLRVTRNSFENVHRCFARM